MSYKLYFNDGNKYKLNQLTQVSDPKKVISNAQKYFNDPDTKVYFSPEKIRSMPCIIHTPKN